MRKEFVVGVVLFYKVGVVRISCKNRFLGVFLVMVLKVVIFFLGVYFKKIIRDVYICICTKICKVVFLVISK